MIADALDETVLEEAQAIVRAEWMRLQHNDSPCEHPCDAPAARACPVAIVTLTTTVKRSWLAQPSRRAGWPTSGGPQRQVWPTQRSPP